MEENKKYLLGIREELEKYYNGFEDEDGNDVSMFDYLQDVLDYEILINSSLEYKACKVWITLGGPNVWIDTDCNEIRLAWGADRESLWLPSEICEEIDNYFEELYSCRQ